MSVKKWFKMRTSYEVSKYMKFSYYQFFTALSKKRNSGILLNYSFVSTQRESKFIPPSWRNQYVWWNLSESPTLLASSGHKCMLPWVTISSFPNVVLRDEVTLNPTKLPHTSYWSQHVNSNGIMWAVMIRN